MVEARAQMIREMSDKGMTQREIAKELGISLGSVNRYLQLSRDDDDYFDLGDGFIDDDEDENENESSLPAGGGVVLNELDELNELNRLFEEKLEYRRLTNAYMQDMGLRGIGYDDIYEEFEKLRREQAERRRLSEPGVCSPPARGGVAATLADGVVGVLTGSLKKLNELNEPNELIDDDDDDDDEDPMARYGLTRDYDAGGSCGANDPELLNELNEPSELNELGESDKLKYKTMDDKVDVGEIVMGRDGQLMKRTNWGWDAL